MTGFRTAALRDFAQGIGPFDPFFGIPVPPASTTTALPAVPAVSTASAVAGHASQVNSLSVPPAWTVASAADIPANAVPPSHVSTAPGSSAGAPGGTVFGETLAGTLAGRAIAAGAAARPRANPANTVIPRSPAGG